jgi:hypothetical protein
MPSEVQIGRLIDVISTHPVDAAALPSTLHYDAQSKLSAFHPILIHK